MLNDRYVILELFIKRKPSLILSGHATDLVPSWMRPVIFQSREYMMDRSQPRMFGDSKGIEIDYESRLEWTAEACEFSTKFKTREEPYMWWSPYSHLKLQGLDLSKPLPVKVYFNKLITTRSAFATLNARSILYII